ncbi:adiponectin receptor [Strigomonas culicis]|uniref:Adiponectin receptor n=1 Tax=Strigomonas culicis TaxID=28005 RepID=S9V1V3_9TRYP|nr:adiponectin receptor [Strigomonas culicis]EPY27962.1 adiponectin receptor [Strigomonas culicis]|eukprot:EPY20881.1 adiponectin receptor [Strigomonas culicis]
MTVVLQRCVYKQPFLSLSFSSMIHEKVICHLGADINLYISQYSFLRKGKKMKERRINDTAPQKAPEHGNTRNKNSVVPPMLSKDKPATHDPHRHPDLKPHNNDPDLPLYRIDQIPEYLQDNRYILASYRAYYSTTACIRSIFRLHNETFNIWTHLLGGLYFVYLVIDLFCYLLWPDYQLGNDVTVVMHEEHNKVHSVVREKGKQTSIPFFIFGFFSVGCVACMLCSAYFHTFLCHMSEEHYRVAHAIDYFGITILTVSSFIPFCYYAFVCDPQWGRNYVIMISCFGVVGMLGPFFRHWTSTAFATKKVLFYVCMVGSGIFPTLHLFIFHPHTTEIPVVAGLLQMLIFYGIGVFIYAFKIPEVFSPGTFDVYCGSHQLWHMFVLAAALTHFFNTVSMYKKTDGVIMCIPE